MTQTLEMQLANIARQLKPKLQNALENEVYEEVKQTGKKHVKEDVYDVYEPQQYERKNLLEKSWGKEKVHGEDAGIAVFNTRYATREDGTKVYVPEIIETGIGYEYPLSQKGFLDGFMGGSRPFIENTEKELMNTNKHKESLKKGLKRQGVKME